MGGVVTIGEPLLILRTRSNSQLEQARVFDVLVAGAEFNVAIGLSRLGVKSKWIGKLVDDPIGRKVVSTLLQYGVDVSDVVWTLTGRTGIAFMELGVPPRPNKVFYYREGSAASQLKPSDIDWQVIRNADLIHISGITPALSEDCKDVVFKVFEEAEAAEVVTSFDVNYRSKLWSKDQARKTVDVLAKGRDILITSVREASALWGLEGRPQEIGKHLRRRFQSKVVVVTEGRNAPVACGDEICVGKVYEVQVLNRMGAGDSFNAGFLYGYLMGDIKEGLDYGSAMAALKLTILEENFPTMLREDVERLIREGPIDVVR